MAYRRKPPVLRHVFAGRHVFSQPVGQEGLATETHDRAPSMRRAAQTRKTEPVMFASMGMIGNMGNIVRMAIA
jgi:hypothetical protein